MGLSIRRLALLVSLSLVFLLTACGANPENAPQAIEGYLNALATGDSARLTAFSCADWESDAMRELDSFVAVTPKLQGVACQLESSEGEVSFVTCTGSIVVTYNDEAQEISLEGRSYRAVFEGGEWRMCGYE